jgi:hypothetical protein
LNIPARDIRNGQDESQASVAILKIGIQSGKWREPMVADEIAPVARPFPDHIARIKMAVRDFDTDTGLSGIFTNTHCAPLAR